MQELAALVGIIAALAIGVVSPGPSFVMVARVAVASSRSQALGAALGMGAGGVLFGAAALFGLQNIFHAVPAVYLGLKVAGGLYLCYLGLLIFTSAKKPLPVADRAEHPGGTANKSFWLGLTTQLSNPKTAIVYASVFAAFLPPHFSLAFAGTLLVIVFLVEAGWYALVALLLSSLRPQQAYLSYKAWVDRTAGVVMFALGMKLIGSATKS
jgi:threonine/homoserine/homoserine lactone efflux protein